MRDLLSQHRLQPRILPGHVVRQQADAGAGEGRGDVGEDVGRGHSAAHPRQASHSPVQIIHGEDGLHVVVQRVLGELRRRLRSAVALQVLPGGVEPQRIVGQMGRSGVPDLRLLDDDLQVQA